jgi:hypothetical protein
MQQRTRSFIDAVAEQVKSNSLLQAESGASGGGRLDVVMELSNQALSHLQFQDPMTQKLSSINGDFELVATRVQRVLDGEVGIEAAAGEQASGGDTPAPGKVTLFDAGETIEPERYPH